MAARNSVKDKMYMSAGKISIRDISHVGIFSAITAVCAQISIPMPYGVPMTLQTFAILLAGIILGSKKGALSAVIYVLIGIVGVPVFANFTGGLGIVIGPTGGFIISFPISAFIAGMSRGKNRKLANILMRAMAGTAINFLCGTIFFCLVMRSGIKTAFMACAIPFIPAEIIKIITAAILGKNINSLLNKNSLFI